MKLVAVLPTLDEAANLRRCVDSLLGLEFPGVTLEVVIIDDASTDGTGELADALARADARIEVIHRRSQRGLGSAYVAGFGAALARGADFVAQLDADLSHDPQALGDLLTGLAHADVVIGSRYLPRGSLDPDWGWHRRWLSRMANQWVVPALLSLPVLDATSGYRLWSAAALRRIDPARHSTTSGYGFQVEMCLLAHRSGLRLAEVPIHFAERGQGRSKMTLAVQLAAVRDILALRWRHRHRHGRTAFRCNHRCDG